MSKLTQHLPGDWREASFVGRVQLAEGPTPVLIRSGRVIDVSRSAPTTADLLAREDAALATGQDLGDLEDFDFGPAWEARDPNAPQILSPLDLQCVKASGVTFAVSAVERVIEERARGDAARAQDIRAALADQG